MWRRSASEARIARRALRPSRDSSGPPRAPSPSEPSGPCNTALRATEGFGTAGTTSAAVLVGTDVELAVTLAVWVVGACTASVVTVPGTASDFAPVAALVAPAPPA